MKKFLLILGVALAATFVTESAYAQVKVGKGQLSGSLESNNIYYDKDNIMQESGFMERPDKVFGSHDYLKLDYTLGRFSAGIQIDGYLPPMYGFDIYTLKKEANRIDGSSMLTGFFTKYVQWEDTNWGVRLGDIYDQFGNGLIFRTYEDRALGFNNAIAGARVHYNFNNYFTIKALAGMPRYYDKRNTNWVWGADLSLSLSDIVGWNNGLIAIEGSYVGRHQNDALAYAEEEYILGLDSKTLNMVSGRLNFEVAGFTLRGEYVTKLNNDIDMNEGLFEGRKGNAIHIDLGYSYKRFSASATFRRQENMNTLLMLGGQGGCNVINYIPVLTRQHTYLLTNLNPYQPTSTGGEIGGQIDLYYSLRNKSNRTKYWNFHANFSTFQNLDYVEYPGGPTSEGKKTWLEINVDAERQWNRKIKTTFLYAYQEYDKNHGLGETQYLKSHIFVADMTYKFNKKHSLHVEAQYLADFDNKQGDWVALLAEYNFAPKFSFYVSDMWNCEKADMNFANQKNYLIHYYQVGASFTHGRTRIQLSYGRNREGVVCSGGVCRPQPAYTGVNLALTTSF